MKLNVPFYSNTPDNTHCYQAALRSVLKYFLPKKDYTWKELDDMTAKKEGLWTWPAKGLIALHEMGFEVIKMDDFDIEEFIRSGEKYLLKKNGRQVSRRQIENSDIAQEREIYKKFLEYKLHLHKLPEIQDIIKLLDEGYLIICNVNARILNNKSGFAGHFVVVTGYDETGLFLHDPGPPPKENRKVVFTLFLNALAYPDDQASNLIGIKY